MVPVSLFVSAIAVCGTDNKTAENDINSVRMILIISRIFDDGDYTRNDVIAFIDLAEKLLGAKPGTLGFITELIRRER